MFGFLITMIRWCNWFVCKVYQVDFFLDIVIKIDNSRLQCNNKNISIQISKQHQSKNEKNSLNQSFKFKQAENKSSQTRSQLNHIYLRDA